MDIFDKEKAKDYIETAVAIELLSYHDENYLSNDLAHNPKKRNETIRELLMSALVFLR